MHIYTLFIYKKCTWGNLLISFFTIMFHKVLNLAPSLLVKSSAFRHTITCYHLTCLPYKQVNLEHSTTFTVFCCRCPNLIEKCCCHEIYKKHNCTKIHRVLNIKELYHWVWWCIILTQLKCVYVTPRWWIKKHIKICRNRWYSVAYYYLTMRECSLTLSSCSWSGS